MDNGPNFNEYSWEELLDVYEKIDREKFPERFATVATLLGKLEIPAVLASDIDANIEDHIDEETSQLRKAQRINEFFNSIESGHSDCLSPGYGDGGSGSDGAGGGE